MLDNIRGPLEAREATLAPEAAREATSIGRVRPEEPDPLRLAYQVDRDRVLHTRVPAPEAQDAGFRRA